MVHIVPFAVDLGLSPFLAAMTISVIGFAGFAGRLAIGPIPHFRPGPSADARTVPVAQATSFFGFTFSTGLRAVIPGCSALWIFLWRGHCLFPALVGDFLGGIAIGAIVGFIFALAGSPAAFGPLIAGYIYDADEELPRGIRIERGAESDRARDGLYAEKAEPFEQS